MERVITTEELADRWKTSVSYLANLRSQGKGCPYVKLGRRVVYQEKDIIAYERARRVMVEFVKPKVRK